MEITKARILTVVPDASHLRLLRGYLNDQKLLTASTLEGMISQLHYEPFDVILLSDLVDDVVRWIRALRAETSLPLIVLTCGPIFVPPLVQCIEAGADDYLDLMQPEILRAKIRGLVRRFDHSQLGIENLKPFEAPGFHFDFSTRELRVRDRAVKLSKTEQRLMRVLTQSAPSTIPLSELYRRVWGKGYDTPESLRTYICYLRQKVEVDPANPQWILTVPGVGYRFAVKGATA